MEEEGWKKDENPYLVVTCLKCKQYMYVKTTQKTKKCLRCGRQHKLLSIINSGEIVKGMTKAVEMVKTRQNELAKEETGTTPEFRAAEDFTVKSRINQPSDVRSKVSFSSDDSDLAATFKKMLHEISSTYSKFPYYVFEILAENYAIPTSELRILVKNSLKEGYLIRSGDNSYIIN